MASDLRVQRVMPPYLGLDQDSAPEVVAPERGPVHTDWLLDRPGKCVMRGPFNQIHDGLTNPAFGAGGRNLVGHTVFDDSILWSFCNDFPGSRIAPWESFWKFAATEAELLQAPAGSSNRVTNLQALTTTDNLAATAGDIGWGNGSRLGILNYQPAIQSIAASEVVQGHRRWPTVLTAWAGGAAGPAVWAATAQPNFTIGVRSHYSRWFLCAARDPSAASGNAINYLADYNPHQIYWSQPTSTGQLAGLYTDWRNPNTLAIQKLTVGQQDAGDACVALAKVERNLMIFKRRSAYVLYGSGEDTWSLRQVSQDTGCLDPRSVVEFQDQVYFMSHRGFYRYDGSQFVDVSGRIRSTLLRRAIEACGPNGADGGYVKASVMPNGYIHVSVGAQDLLEGTNSTTFNGYYCPATDSWSNLAIATTAVVHGCQPFGTLTLANYVIPYSAQTYWSAPHLFQPELASTADYGLDTHPTDAAIRAATPAAFSTRLYNLVSPVWSAQMQRFLIDYQYKLAAGGDDSLPAWRLRLVNGEGEVLMAQTDLPATGASSTHAYRRRKTIDTFRMTGNAADVQVEVSRPQADPITKAEVYAMDIQYQAAQERRSQ